MDKRIFNFVVVNEFSGFRDTIIRALREKFPSSSFHQFPHGFEARKWVRENPEEKNLIIITEQEMRHLDGKGIVQFIKSRPDLRDIPIIMVSGYAKIKEIAEDWGCRFLQRPLDTEELLKIVFELIGKMKVEK